MRRSGGITTEPSVETGNPAEVPLAPRRSILRAEKNLARFLAITLSNEARSMESRESLGLASAASPAGSGIAARRLCVVSRNPLVSGPFIAGLTSLVGSRDELEIVVDRRRSSPAHDHPSVERRQRSNVVRALERDGFAVVPMPPSRATEQLEAPVERGSREEAYEQTLERLLRLKHRRSVRLKRWLILSALMNAIVVLLLLPAATALLRQARAVAPATTNLSADPPSPAGRPLSPSRPRESQEPRP
jgi:hypothetical protein